MNTRQVAHRTQTFNASHEGRAREIVIMSLASAVAIIFCFILALLGVSLQAIDRWTLILSPLWFAALYLSSRKIDLIKKMLGKAVLATTSAAVALVGSVSYAFYFMFDTVKHVIDKLHMW